MLIGVAVGVGVGVGGGSVFVISSSVRVGRISAVSVTLMVMDASMRVLVMFASMVLVGKSEVVKVRSSDMVAFIIVSVIRMGVSVRLPVWVKVGTKSFVTVGRAVRVTVGSRDSVRFDISVNVGTNDLVCVGAGSRVCVGVTGICDAVSVLVIVGMLDNEEVGCGSPESVPVSVEVPSDVGVRGTLMVSDMF